MAFSLERCGITGPTIRRDPSAAVLYDDGAAVRRLPRPVPRCYCGRETGRSPAHERLLEEAASAPNIR